LRDHLYDFVPGRTEEMAMAGESAELIERWTAKRRVALAVSILKGETSEGEAARTHGLTVAEVENWRERFLLGAENALRTRPKDEEALKDEQIKKLKQKIGELVLDNDICIVWRGLDGDGHALVQTLFITPGSLWEEGSIESFNGKLRDELLDRELFDTLWEVKMLVERW
jgi:hypothetical protein